MIINYLYSYKIQIDICTKINYYFKLHINIEEKSYLNLRKKISDVS